MFFQGFMTTLFLSIACLAGTSSPSRPVVQRGGEVGAAATVSIQLGNGVIGVWNTHTGTLLKALIDTSEGRDTLVLEVDPPSWFLVSDKNEQKLVTYSWRGYRIEDDQVVLMHELRSAEGAIRTVEERPVSAIGDTGLLAIQSTFDTVGSEVVSSRVIKRIRTGTQGGVTMPITTNGDLIPLGLNDNFLADVVFRKAGGTIVTISFNGYWSGLAMDDSEKEDSK